MRSLHLTALPVVALCLSLVPAMAQMDEDGPIIAKSLGKGKSFGYTDPQTGVFHPLIQVAPEATASPLTGTLQLTINVTLKTSFAKGSILVCSSIVTPSSASMTNDTILVWVEQAYTTQTLNGTSTATCVVTIPYSWAIPAASSMVVNELEGEYTVGVVPAGTAAQAIASSTPFRSATADFVNTKTFPSTGATTKYTIAATL